MASIDMPEKTERFKQYFQRPEPPAKIGFFSLGHAMYWPQFEGLAALPFGKNLQSIYTSASLPQMGIAADEKRSSTRDRQKMLRALRGMCTHQDGKKLCQLFGIDSFDLPDGKLFDSVIKAWESKP